MSFYFRDRPKFGDRLRGKSGDELLQEIKQQFDEDSKSFFEPANRTGRDPFERHSTFSRGFPFDDDGFGRRGDIRAHLDDLAARHPEFADHLLGPPWGDVPLRSSPYNRNRDTGNSGRNNPQGYSDEDARSQASGSSAASGASAASSHSETDNGHNRQEKFSNYEQPNRRSQIPQYGLRNTVDIGQHHHNMENADRGNRGQRSMSAPPENRQPSSQQPAQQDEQTQQQQSQPQGQRYVSRIDIIPQHNQQSQQQKPQQQPQQSQSQQKAQQQGNVRHIPIFVEGRDDPVVPRTFDHEASNFRREPSPTQFHRPQFQTRSPFGQPFVGRHRQWSPHFQDHFYPDEFEQSPRRQQQTHGFQHPRQQPYVDRQPQQQQYAEKQPQPQQYAERQPQPQQYAERQPQQQQYAEKQQQQQPQQPQQQQEPPKPKPCLPKDPLERVALVQKEVDSLAEQVRQYNGSSRTNKEYVYLDEMLTRELIKLDDIETEGRDNVRQARRNAIKTIQETISLLESKAPLPSQKALPEEQEIQVDQPSENVEQFPQTESMEADQKVEDQSQNKEAIPLPPAPPSPIKSSEEKKGIAEEKTENPANHQTSQTVNEPMDTAPAENEPNEADHKMEVQLQSKEAIPLPPAPSSATKGSEENKEKSEEKTDNSATDQTTDQQQETGQTVKQPPTDTAPAEKQQIGS